MTPVGVLVVVPPQQRPVSDQPDTHEAEQVTVTHTRYFHRQVRSNGLGMSFTQVELSQTTIRTNANADDDSHREREREQESRPFSLFTLVDQIGKAMGLNVIQRFLLSFFVFLESVFNPGFRNVVSLLNSISQRNRPARDRDNAPTQAPDTATV